MDLCDMIKLRKDITWKEDCKAMAKGFGILTMLLLPIAIFFFTIIATLFVSWSYALILPFIVIYYYVIDWDGMVKRGD